MFTGIIEEIGSIKDIKTRGSGRCFQFAAQKILADLQVDQSVAVNGVCLTVVEITKDGFFVDAVSETLAKSTLMVAQKMDAVNFERALRFSDRLGGHLVQGHVDGIGTIEKLQFGQTGSILEIEIPETLRKYTIAKGSIAIDGVSLTIAEKKETSLRIAVIPHTFSSTIFQHKKNGDSVNVEVDFFAKYIEQFLTQTSRKEITTEWLKQHGF